ncbi:MAG: class I SAM-dependent methyltransferase [Desulfuromonadales bacterium]|nr:class I SAM-dependent methyltransferase [Desulfuromonadales bacterium]
MIKIITTGERHKFLEEFPKTIMNVTDEDAMLLRILIEAKGAQRGLEVGSSTGYGALNMGVAFERTGGKLVTIDTDPQMVKVTKENLKIFGLEKTVTAIEGDAIDVLQLIEGQFDFVFLDAVKEDYFKYFEAIRPKLDDRALLVADNVILSADKMRDFFQFMERSSEWEMVIVQCSSEKGDGMAICKNISISDCPNVY